MLPDIPCNSELKLQVDEVMVEFSPAAQGIQVRPCTFHATLGSHGNSSVTMATSHNLGTSAIRETSSLPSRLLFQRYIPSQGSQT